MKRKAITIGLIGAFVFAIALAASPQLHARFHSDANRTEHNCAVTMIASGSYDHATQVPLVGASAPAIQISKVLALTPRWVESPFLGASIFEHAPPLSS